MEFIVLPRNVKISGDRKNVVYLEMDNWNDFSYVTMFYVSYRDSKGTIIDIGRTKIGFKGQTTSESTYSVLKNNPPPLTDLFFSLGESVDFYKKIHTLDSSVREKILIGLRDMVFNPNLIEHFNEEPVFGTSLLRDHSLSGIKGKLARILEGSAELTPYSFSFKRPISGGSSGVDMGFNVYIEKKPNTNIHAIIGRNGAGKTTILNGMIDSVVNRTNKNGVFCNRAGKEIASDYFSSLVSVSFSAFDPFIPPKEQNDPAKGPCYFYIGLKSKNDPHKLRSIQELRVDCIKALISCFSNSDKTKRWLTAIGKLGSDENFSSMNLERLLEIHKETYARFKKIKQIDSIEYQDLYFEASAPYLDNMSSGHAIVLLTTTRLVATVEEKTLVLLDEPESHLHPPLLSAFIRALSDLLHDQNGVAIIATHSPVVLQEIPKSCVWIMYRTGIKISINRPKIETFAENVGVLTAEVFNLEVERSGFHELLASSVRSGASYDEILEDYNDQIGFEGKAILKVLLSKKEKGTRR